MAEVLYQTNKSTVQPYYATSSLKRSSNSYSSFLSQAGAQYSQIRPAPPTSPPTDQVSGSTPSNTTSVFQSLSDIDSASLPPTPASSISFEDALDREEEDEDIAFPSYDDGVQFYHQDEPLHLPPSPVDDREPEPTVKEQPATTGPTRTDSPLRTPNVVDDTAARPNPSRHVDYLSHDWREEDIWSSWRHIVSQRKVYGQRSRLENASWRTWAKSKYRLPTVSPETLNWLKESDVTWLYGPLQPATSHPITHSSANPSPAHLSSRTSFVHKKPILKKRSMSEVMLQRSISANSLVKQAAAAIQAQQSGHTPLAAPQPIRRASDYSYTDSASQGLTRDQLDYFSTISSSGDSTPSEGSKRHIRFDDKVEQCIALESNDVGNESGSDSSDRDSSDSDSSDDGVLTMRKPRRRRPTMVRKRNAGESKVPIKTVERLPDAILKYKTDSPEPVKTPSTINVPFLKSWGSSKLVQSDSQETLRPSNSTRNFLIASDDDDDVDPDMSWQPSIPYTARIDGTGPGQGRLSSPDEEHSSLRRTPSGMFMPYDEDEDDIASEMGLFGRVSETINTAKDIAHVIWNVGWRK